MGGGGEERGVGPLGCGQVVDLVVEVDDLGAEDGDDAGGYRGHCRTDAQADRPPLVHGDHGRQTELF